MTLGESTFICIMFLNKFSPAPARVLYATVIYVIDLNLNFCTDFFVFFFVRRVCVFIGTGN